MWRDKIKEIKAEKKISSKTMSERSGLTVETIYRTLNPRNEGNNSVNLNTFFDICASLEIEPWEVLYVGDKSFVSIQAENQALRAERDVLVQRLSYLEEQNKVLQARADSLVDVLVSKLKQ